MRKLDDIETQSDGTQVKVPRKHTVRELERKRIFFNSAKKQTFT